MAKVWLNKKQTIKRDQEIVRLRTQQHLNYEQLAAQFRTSTTKVGLILKQAGLTNNHNKEVLG